MKQIIIVAFILFAACKARKTDTQTSRITYFQKEHDSLYAKGKDYIYFVGFYADRKDTVTANKYIDSARIVTERVSALSDSLKKVSHLPK